MSFIVRGRLAIACGAVLVVVLGIYAAMVGSLEASQRRDLHRRDEEQTLTALADTLASRIAVAYEKGKDSITLGESSNRPITGGRVQALTTPVAAPRLRAFVDSVNAAVWVLDRFGVAFYSNSLVRDVAVNDRLMLDTAVASITPSASASGKGVIAHVAGGRVTEFPFHGQVLLLYSVGVEPHPGGVNRVVLGFQATDPPPGPLDLWLPFLLIIPIVVGLAFASASVFTRITLKPVDERIAHLIGEVEAISDGRSLHRRLPADQDIGDHLMRLTHTLNAMIGRLETSFAGLRRFTADASHELKTPLTVLRADIERAMATQHKRPEQLEALEEALAETTRMADLVDSLLTLARADEGRFDLHREEVDLEALARDVYETALLLGESTLISVRMAAPAHAIVMGDRGRLRQLFLNLITNAIKYTSPGGEVALSLTVDGGSALFSVRDSGIGIAAADLPHVFERFWRADRARSRVGERGGFGLGMAISQYIATAHGGTLTVQSKLGRGSTFTVTLPVIHPAPAPTITS